MKKLIISAALGLMIPLMSIGQSTLGPGATGSSLTVAGSPHNFSGQTWNSYNSTTMQGGQICQPCHTPHNAISPTITGNAAPLWNHTFTTATYSMYTGFEFGTLTTTGAYIGYGVTAPDGTSKLCLSCHDGSVALGAYGGQTGTLYMNDVAPGANLGTDLTNDHPISFPYDSVVAGGVHDKNFIYSQYAAGGSGTYVTYTSSGKTVGSKLDANGEVQCTSCHGPHSNSRGYQLSMDNRGSALCLSCHKK